MANMEDIRYHPVAGMGAGGRVKGYLPASLEKEDMEGHPFWLEEIVRGAFRLCSAEDVSGRELEGIALDCPNCGRLLKAATGQQDGKVHAIYTCAGCR